MGPAMKIRSYDDVRRLTAYLQTVADWKDGIERRMAACATAEEQDQLLEEGVALLKLMGRLGAKRRAA
jgi:hypothetical protein